MKIVREGTRWWGGDNKRFLVLAVIENDRNETWVHYREDKNKENPQEYSCYLESFLQRFSRLPE